MVIQDENNSSSTRCETLNNSNEEQEQEVDQQERFIEFDEARYFGTVNKSEQPHGMGKMFWRDGTKYRGEF